MSSDKKEPSNSKQSRNFRIAASIILVIGCLLSYLFYMYWIPDEDKSRINGISFFGTVLSVIGLLITYLQIVSVKTTARQTEEAVKNNTSQLNSLLKSSDMSKCIKFADEAIRFLEAGKNQEALLRMRDLKGVVVATSRSNELSPIVENSNLQPIIQQLGADINNLSENIMSNKKAISVKIMLRNLNEASTTFTEWETHIKHHLWNLPN